MATIAILLFSTMGVAYGELQSVNVPFAPPYMLDCSLSQDDFLIFNCIWRSDRIPDDVKAELEQLARSIDILPTEEYEINKAKIIMSWLSPPDPALIIEEEPPKLTVEELLKEKLDPGVREAVDKLAECQYGYEGWEAIQQKSDYEIPDQIIAWDGNLRNDVIVKRLNLAYESCRIQAEYPLSPAYQHFIEADLLGFDLYGRSQPLGAVTNFTRSEIYKPLDQLDFLSSQKTARDFMCSDEGKARGLCSFEEFSGVNRGNPEPIVKDLRSYNDYINFKAGQIQTPQDYTDTIAEAKKAQCVVHYPLYKHKEVLPVWLEHCLTLQDIHERAIAELNKICRDDNNLIVACEP